MKRCFRCDLYKGDVIPVQIRNDLTVRILGVPSDLTQQEAEKLSRLFLALADKPPA